MKYLRLFESMKMYDKIDSSVFDMVIFGPDCTTSNEIISDHIKNTWDDFTEDEVLDIHSMYNPHKIVLGFDSETKPFNVRANKKSLSINIDSIDCTQQYLIYKLKDEWYYIMNITYPPGRMHTISVEYFKCDQWDGLIECLSNIINI